MMIVNKQRRPNQLQPSDERIRDLIGGLECCHHKAQRHVELIIEAIGRGGADDVDFPRRHAQVHPALRIWRNAVDMLHAWLDEDVSELSETMIADLFADELLVALGPPSPLKRWQVQRVIERINSFVDPTTPYRYLRRPDYVLAGDEPEEIEFYFHTRRTLIREPASSHEQGLSLAVAIDMLLPCNWNFPRNLRIVLRAIGGDLHSPEPFAACGRNITLNPIRAQMQRTTRALDQFCGQQQTQPVDERVIQVLGQPTTAKQSLAWALSSRVRWQLRL